MQGSNERGAGLARLLAGLALALFVAVTLPAQPTGHFPMRTYGFQDGLEDLSVNALAQDRAGFLWAGTDSGLFRFDGHRFERVELPPGYGYVTALLAAADGQLWVGTRHGLGVFQPPQFRFRPFAELEGRRVNGLGQDSAAGIWVLSGDRLLRSGDGRTFQEREKSGVARGMFAHPDCPDVLVSSSRELWSIPGGTGAGQRMEVPLTGGEELLLAARDGLGHLWARTSAALYRKGGEERGWTRMPEALGGSPPNNLRISRDREGWVWINTLHGVHRVRGSESIELKGGDRGFAPIGGLVDHEGTPWIAANGVLQVLGAGRWEIHNLDEGLPSNVVWHMLRDAHGRPWLATDRGLVVGEGSRWRLVRAGQFSRLRQAPDGSLLAVGGPGGTLYRIDPRSLGVEAIRVDAIPASGESRGLAVEPDGRVWVSDFRDGVASGRRLGGRWLWERLLINGQPPKGVWQIVQDPGGSIFLASQGGVHLLQEGRWEEVSGTLPYNPFSALRTSEGEVWVFYFDRFCLTRHRREGGAWKRVEEWWPLPEKSRALVISNAMVEGRIWVGTTQGMGLLDPKSRRVEHWYSPGEGIPSANANNHALVVEPDGKLWYGTTEGIGILRLRPSLPATGIPAPVLLSWEGGGRGLPTDGTRPAIAPGRSLEARFALNTFSQAVGTCLEARLVGVDAGWERLQEQKVRYTALPPGSYRLEVRGNGPGRDPGPAIALEFRMLPPWWQTWWAMALGLASLLLGALGVGGLRHRALRRHNLELQQEVAARTEDLRRANASLEAASRAKSLFVASMSHELRTPLNAILLFSELLADDARTRGDAETGASVEKVMGAGRHLLSLINDILDLSKIEAGEMKVDWAEEDLGVILMEVSETLGPLARKNGSEVRTLLPGGPRGFRTDRTKLRQVLLNLGGNACKFTERGVITLALEVSGESAVIEVRDTGKGMSEEEQGRLFKDYEQAGAEIQKRYGGTGLGLAISRRLIDLLGGRISVRSAPGQGSTFRVELQRS